MTDAATSSTAPTPEAWDTVVAGLKATNAPEADAFIKETYRPGWEIA